MPRTVIATTILLIADISAAGVRQAPIGAPVPPLGAGPIEGWLANRSSRR